MAETQMVNLTIEGRPVSVPAGTSMLEAAKVAGVLIPHYCYHPGLPVAGVCRMCLVEVEKMPKLAPACATSVTEGQVIHVHSEKAREARKGVLEFLLINHPLDCPICDQSGECELQDYTFQEGRASSRYRESKRFNPVEDFGGDVLYVPNRCILCTRCVRFMDVVAEDTALNVSERGDRAYIGRASERGLTHAWASNVVDLCPVGALLSKDFLNKARAWELDRAASICPNCTQGCNVVLETRDNVVVRMRPRSNDDVNQYFACDYGRLNYRWLNGRDRVEMPLVARDGRLVETEWELALAAAADAMRGRRAHVVASPMLPNEALWLLKGIVASTGGTATFSVETGAEAPLPGVKDLALRAERAANVHGAELLGFTRTDAPASGVAAGDVLVVVGETDVAQAEAALAAAAGRAGTVIVLAPSLPSWAASASIVLPIANMSEEEGTFTNLRGRVQRFLQAKAAPGFTRPSWYVLGDLLAALGQGSGFFTAGEAFAAMTAAVPAFAGMSYETLGLKGAMVRNASSAAPAGAATSAGAAR